MSFQQLQASIEATFKAYHEETSERFRRLEQVIFSERMPFRQKEDFFPHGVFQTAPGHGGRFEHFDPSRYAPFSRMREPTPSVYFRPESILLSHVGGDYEDLECFECTYVLLQPIYVSVNNGVIINELGGGRKGYSGPPPEWTHETGFERDDNYFRDDDVVIGSNSGFAAGGSGDPGRGGEDGGDSRPNTPRSNSTVESSSGSSSSSSSVGSKKKGSVSSDDGEVAASVKDKQVKNREGGDLGQVL
ncbi:hypothetical protein PRZ48_007577 [Zasmidium cellare]|uniref:Uncharacterized protein n=1 Tax=Zasmidium cellare TaxID=395010 RepID=A0ABR0EKM2_ZASCE|nr:hypothetical protein PRZ48_007577 [Zasmidium cellare]